MITPEQRRKMESEWSSEDRSIVNAGRLASGAILLLLIVGLAWIGVHDASLGDAQSASAAKPVSSSRHAYDTSAVRAGGELVTRQRTHKN
jgi:hypothetical protein